MLLWNMNANVKKQKVFVLALEIWGFKRVDNKCMLFYLLQCFLGLLLFLSVFVSKKNRFFFFICFSFLNSFFTCLLRWTICVRSVFSFSIFWNFPRLGLPYIVRKSLLWFLFPSLRMFPQFVFTIQFARAGDERVYIVLLCSVCIYQCAFVILFFVFFVSHEKCNTIEFICFGSGFCIRSVYKHTMRRFMVPFTNHFRPRP